MIEFNQAPTWKRYLGNIIDYSICYLLIFLYISYFGEDTPDGKQVSGFMTLPIILYWLFYFILLESLNEATPGYLALDLRVIRADHERIDLKNVFMHHILDSVNLASAGIVSYLLIRNSDNGQSLGGIVSKTLVIEDK